MKHFEFEEDEDSDSSSGSSSSRSSTSGSDSNSNLNPLSNVDDVDFDADQDENIYLDLDADLIVDNNSDSYWIHDLTWMQNRKLTWTHLWEMKRWRKYQMTKMVIWLQESKTILPLIRKLCILWEQLAVHPQLAAKTLFKVNRDSPPKEYEGRLLSIVKEQQHLPLRCLQIVYKKNKENKPSKLSLPIYNTFDSSSNHACPFFGSEADRNKEHSQQRTNTSVKPPTSSARPRKSPRTKNSKTDN
ncbi:unnamed protein product [Caenorhabditis brenneri]